MSPAECLPVPECCHHHLWQFIRVWPHLPRCRNHGSCWWMSQSLQGKLPCEDTVRTLPLLLLHQDGPSLAMGNSRSELKGTTELWAPDGCQTFFPTGKNSKDSCTTTVMKNQKAIYNIKSSDDSITTKQTNKQKRPMGGKSSKKTWWQLPTNWSIKRMNPSHLGKSDCKTIRLLPSHRVSQDPRKGSLGQCDPHFDGFFCI